jgi:hypothetical protein
MAPLPVPLNPHEDIALVKLAREIAIEHFPIETILKTHQITPEAWERIKDNPRFTALLEREIADWQGALNTHERTKLKAAAMVEEYLPEANKLINSSQESLPAKTELLKLITRIAGMGERTEISGGGGERFVVTINLGADQKLSFEKTLPDKCVEGECREL